MKKRVNVTRGTEVDIRWLKVDWTDFTVNKPTDEFYL